MTIEEYNKFKIITDVEAIFRNLFKSDLLISRTLDFWPYINTVRIIKREFPEDIKPSYVDTLILQARFQPGYYRGTITAAIYVCDELKSLIYSKIDPEFLKDKKEALAFNADANRRYIDYDDNRLLVQANNRMSNIRLREVAIGNALSQAINNVKYLFGLSSQILSVGLTDNELDTRFTVSSRSILHEEIDLIILREIKEEAAANIARYNIISSIKYNRLIRSTKSTTNKPAKNCNSPPINLIYYIEKSLTHKKLGIFLLCPILLLSLWQ